MIFSRGKQKDRLRAFALGTLEPADARRIESDLDTIPGMREKLAEVRAEIARLDGLPEAAPENDLTTLALDRIHDAQNGPRPSFVPLWQWAAALTAVVIIAAALLPALNRAREASRRASSQSNMKQLGTVFKMYAGENQGQFPPPAPYPGVWMFDLREVWPDYIDDPGLLVDPKHPDAGKLLEQLRAAIEKPEPDWEGAMRIAAQSYTYPGFVVTDDDEALALAQSEDWRASFAEGQRPYTIEVEGKSLPRPREGVERFFITDINNPAAGTTGQSNLPILFETVPGRPANGRSVLYMDGHVVFLEPGVFPVTPAASKAFTPPPVEE